MKIQFSNFLFSAALLLLSINCFAQQRWPYERSKSLPRKDYTSVYVDTTTLDTMFENIRLVQRIIKSSRGVELARGSFGDHNHPAGFWVFRYPDGALKETGEYAHRQKAGTWTYFYENGVVQKQETFQLPYADWVTEQHEMWDTLQTRTYLLHGLYTEFYENGQLKQEGHYDIVEAFTETDTVYTFNFDDYSEVLTPIRGAFWRPKSVKVGHWKYLDESGKLIDWVFFPPVSAESEGLRPVFYRYNELIQQRKKE